MANAERKVRRTLHFRFTMPSADPAQILSFVNASKPFYEMLGGTEVRGTRRDQSETATSPHSSVLIVPW